MRRRCAWCGRDMGSKEPLNDAHTTHGVCPPCSEKILGAATCSSIASRCLGPSEMEALIAVQVAESPLHFSAETLHD